MPRLVQEKSYARILLSNEEIRPRCKIGQGAGCCIWLVVGADGFECLSLNRPKVLVDRLAEGTTNAKWEGCGITLEELQA